MWGYTQQDRTSVRCAGYKTLSNWFWKQNSVLLISSTLLIKDKVIDIGLETRKSTVISIAQSIACLTRRLTWDRQIRRRRRKN